MIFFYITPFLLILNIYFVLELHKWLNALPFLPAKLNKCIKIVTTILWAFFFMSTYIAFAIPRDIKVVDHPMLYSIRRILKQFGNYHLGVSIYLGMTLLLILLCRLIERIYHARKKSAGNLKCKLLGQAPTNVDFYKIRRALLGLANLTFIVLITCYGVHNAKDIKVNQYDICVNKSCEDIGDLGDLEDTGNIEDTSDLGDLGDLEDIGDTEDLNIVLIADLHMGYSIGNKQIAKMVDLVNKQNADLVIVAGDIFDNEYEALEDPELMADMLSSMKSTYGTYAVLGNHDVSEAIIGGFTFDYDNPSKGTSDEMDQFLESCGWTLLRDEAVLVNDAFYLYGRPDYEKPGKDIVRRKNASEIVAGLNLCKPVIVIDHEPRELDELAAAGVDIDLCGHTHDGQFFPMNLISRYYSWENSAGLLEKEQMKNIVTSGVGLFGPNIRIGTQAEICTIRVHFEP